MRENKHSYGVSARRCLLSGTGRCPLAGSGRRLLAGARTGRRRGAFGRSAPTAARRLLRRLLPPSCTRAALSPALPTATRTRRAIYRRALLRHRSGARRRGRRPLLVAGRSHSGHWRERFGRHERRDALVAFGQCASSGRQRRAPPLKYTLRTRSAII